ncbi:lipocalin family protein [Brumimicrobium mesophilum]|uniref:lipocalin family protein n=1 Tax=Brumimicrobium mesophilum TaxID=392717 RepID=UPI000D13F08A|nr:lipocalin family protein [Brumimicrobium mesophilum]
MKKLLFLLPILLIFQNLHAQSIQGKWGINQLITDSETKEYRLFQTEADRFHYGNNIVFKEDGTFESYYTAPCGNDCFTNTSGTYKIINTTHLTLFLQTITKNGMCEGNSKPNKSLGVYSIHHMNGGIQLIKSSSLILNEEKEK